VVIIKFILFFKMFCFQVKCMSMWMGMGTRIKARPVIYHLVEMI